MNKRGGGDVGCHSFFCAALFLVGNAPDQAGGKKGKGKQVESLYCVKAAVGNLFQVCNLLLAD